MSHYRCCCPGGGLGCCGLCVDGTPNTLTLTITGSSLRGGGCFACGDGTSVNAPGGNFDGTYTLTRTSQCCWTASFATDVITYYTNADCTGGETIVLDGVANITLCKYVDGATTYWSFVIVGTSETPAIAAMYLFTATPEVATDNCLTDLPTFANLADGSTCALIGTGGTAAITFGAGDTAAAGC